MTNYSISKFYFLSSHPLFHIEKKKASPACKTIKTGLLVRLISPLTGGRRTLMCPKTEAKHMILHPPGAPHPYPGLYLIVLSAKSDDYMLINSEMTNTSYMYLHTLILHVHSVLLNY